jgi:prepilin-type N-terminal cleavage/methylation domain-containing protein
MRRRRSAADRGLTLVEVLVVMVIVAIALGVTAPSMANAYDNWILRSAGRSAAAMFRQASDVARREGAELTGYYANGRVMIAKNGKIERELEIAPSIKVQPEKPRGVVFLPTGQIVASEPFTFENSRGRRLIVEIDPLPGRLVVREEMP